MKNMKSFVAIGRFKDSNNITRIVDSFYTKKQLKENLKGNRFVAYMIMDEKEMKELRDLFMLDWKEFDRECCKVSKSYQMLESLEDYLEQNMDKIITEMYYENIKRMKAGN